MGHRRPEGGGGAARRIARRRRLPKPPPSFGQARDAAAALESKEDATLEELEKCPDVGTIEMELDQLRARYRDVADLNDALAGIKSGGGGAAAAGWRGAKALEIGDAPSAAAAARPQEAERQAALRPAHALLHVYLEGRRRDPRRAQVHGQRRAELRPGAPRRRRLVDARLRVPGVARGDSVPRKRAAGGHRARRRGAGVRKQQGQQDREGRGVSLVRCRQVSKPRGAKAGLVHLSGDVRGAAVTAKDVKQRLEAARAKRGFDIYNYIMNITTTQEPARSTARSLFTSTRARCPRWRCAS